MHKFAQSRTTEVGCLGYSERWRSGGDVRIVARRGAIDRPLSSKSACSRCDGLLFRNAGLVGLLGGDGKPALVIKHGQIELSSFFVWGKIFSAQLRHFLLRKV
jgi:hypothetical protein